MTTLDIGFSTCPNDTFIFHAMLQGLVDTAGFTFTPHMHDVEELNQMAFGQALHISKLSFYAYLKLQETYDLLDSGAALGFGCGPLLVGMENKPFAPDAKIAVPGRYTTAYLLLKLWNPHIRNIEITRFDHILDGVKAGKYDAGLIIHEGRFIYPNYGCTKIIDLGEWWESETNAPIPLGCIAIRRDQNTLKSRVETILRDSVRFALDNRTASRDFVKKHAREMDDDVIDGHIDLYVNALTLSMGDRGKQAVDKLEEMARWKKIL